jgi:hypothetical protein
VETIRAGEEKDISRSLHPVVAFEIIHSVVGNVEILVVIIISWLWAASELCRPSDRRLSAKLVPTFAGRRYYVVSPTYPYGRILGFLDRSRYYFFQVAPQLYPRG